LPVRSNMLMRQRSWMGREAHSAAAAVAVEHAYRRAEILSKIPPPRP
jgi:hypothetical protein